MRENDGRVWRIRFAFVKKLENLVILETTARETKLRFFNFCSRGKVIDRKIIRTRIDGYRFEEEGAS